VGDFEVANGDICRTAYVFLEIAYIFCLAVGPESWAEIDHLIRLTKGHSTKLTREMLLEVIATNDKQLFALSSDGSAISSSVSSKPIRKRAMTF
jgi:RNA:NAD 2'-phosphotransferase (TPT1/KptA family)